MKWAVASMWVALVACDPADAPEPSTPADREVELFEGGDESGGSSAPVRPPTRPLFQGEDPPDAPSAVPTRTLAVEDVVRVAMRISAKDAPAPSASVEVSAIGDERARVALAYTVEQDGQASPRRRLPRVSVQPGSTTEHAIDLQRIARDGGFEAGGATITVLAALRHPVGTEFEPILTQAVWLPQTPPPEVTDAD